MIVCLIYITYDGNSYPKGLIVAFKLKSTSDGSCAEGNGANDPVSDSENAIEESKEITEDVCNDIKDETIPKENVDGKNHKESEGKETGNGEKSSESPIAESEEKEKKTNAAAYKDDKNVVMREDLKSVFQKFGTVKVKLCIALPIVWVR